MRINKIAKRVSSKYLKQAWSFATPTLDKDKLKWHPNFFDILDLRSTEYLISLFGIYSQMYSTIEYAHDSCLLSLEEQNLLEDEIVSNNVEIEKHLKMIKLEHAKMVKILTNNIRIASQQADEVSVITKLNYEFKRILEKSKDSFQMFFKKEDLNKSSALVNLKGHYLTMIECTHFYHDSVTGFIKINGNSALRKQSKAFDSIVNLASDLNFINIEVNNLLIRNYNILNKK